MILADGYEAFRLLQYGFRLGERRHAGQLNIHRQLIVQTQERQLVFTLFFSTSPLRGQDRKVIADKDTLGVNTTQQLGYKYMTWKYI